MFFYQKEVQYSERIYEGKLPWSPDFNCMHQESNYTTVPETMLNHCMLLFAAFLRFLHFLCFVQILVLGVKNMLLSPAPCRFFNA